jgi:two-component system, chemotaxis family, response regulator Rcp1
VEDNRSDVFLIRTALASANLEVALHVFPDGEKATRFFEDVDADDSIPCPALVILDINLPKKHGGEVLQQMRKSRRCSEARVVVVTSSDSAVDRSRMANLGIDGYFRKPSDFEEFMKLGEVVRALLRSVSGSGSASPSTVD